MIINFLSIIVAFLIAWITGFIVHEFMHLWEAKRQGANGHIKFRFYHGIPSLIINYENLEKAKYPWLIDFAGGLYTALLFIPLAILFFFIWYPLYFGIITTGFVNLVYSIFEVSFIRRMDMKEYMKLHYILYATLILVCVILEGPRMLEYLVTGN